MKVFKSGATSTVEKPRYDVVPKELIQYAAERFAYGISRGHAKDNWKSIKIDEDFQRDRKNHAFEHFLHWIETGDKEQLKAVICNLAMFAWLAEQPVEEPVEEVRVVEDIDAIAFPAHESTVRPNVDTTISLNDGGSLVKRDSESTDDFIKRIQVERAVAYAKALKNAQERQAKAETKPCSTCPKPGPSNILAGPPEPEPIQTPSRLTQFFQTLAQKT